MVFYNTEIAASMGCSRNTVAGVLRRAEACGPAYPLPAEMSDKQIAEALFPATASKPTYKMPDYAYVHKELHKDGVTLNLLWLEYCENCRNSGELPYRLFPKSEGLADLMTNALCEMD